MGVGVCLAILAGCPAVRADPQGLRDSAETLRPNGSTSRREHCERERDSSSPHTTHRIFDPFFSSEGVEVTDFTTSGIGARDDAENLGAETFFCALCGSSGCEEGIAWSGAKKAWVCLNCHFSSHKHKKSGITA